MVDITKYGITPFGATPNEIQLEHYKLAKKAFIHFGMNTFSGAEWGNGTEKQNMFAPTECDTDQWVKVIKDAGFGLIIITAKHHDGFCLWPSRYTEHSVKNSPYKDGKGDIIREFTDSCRKYGVKAGVYISPWDRNSPYWGSDDYNDYYANQLTELMTQYGDIHEVWWDGAGSSEAKYDWPRWEGIVRKYQPHAAIFGSMGAAEYVDLRWVGNEKGYAGETHFASIDPEYLEVETPAMLNIGEIGARKYIPSETDVSIRPGWFYHQGQDDAVKSVSHLNKIWFESVGRNSMMLLNFPPDRRGLICDTDAQNAYLSHKCIERMLSVNLADNARITANGRIPMSVLTDDDSGEPYTVYRGDIFDIVLDKPEKINVFIVGELVEAGERITAFTLESVDADGNTALLYNGTSAGYCRAVKLPEGGYSHLRFTVKAASAEPIIRSFGLHYFEDMADDKNTAGRKNLAVGDEADTELSDDGKALMVAFGGIYPFGHVEFGVKQSGEWRIYAFNGTSYILAAQGIAAAGRVTVDLPETADGSYRIKIEADGGIDMAVPTVVSVC